MIMHSTMHCSHSCELHLMVCASISASLIGLAPLETLTRRRLSMAMKSDALMTPITALSGESQSGADAIPCTVKCECKRLGMG